MRFLAVLLLALSLAAGPARGADTGMADQAGTEKIRSIVREVLREYVAALGDKQTDPVAREAMRNVVQDNRDFMRRHGPQHFRPLLGGQRPRVTLLTCADSQLHTHALDASPDGDLYVVRNLGNQMAIAEGSVHYGVRYLKTPLLLIVGHTACAAIQAAAGDYSAAPAPIRMELEKLYVPKDEPGIAGVAHNVHHQVRGAMNAFESEVLSGQLTVVGAVYDFGNELKRGQGRLNIINVNGETDPVRIAALELIKYAETPAPKTTGKGRSRTSR